MDVQKVQKCIYVGDIEHLQGEVILCRPLPGGEGKIIGMFESPNIPESNKWNDVDLSDIYVIDVDQEGIE